MGMVGKGMTVAVLLTGMAASAALAQQPDGDLHSAAPKPKAFWDGWFTAAAKPAEKKPDALAAPPAGPSAAEIAAATRKRELASYSRRMEVCDRLMDVAVQNNDEAMQTRIEQLKDRAWNLYQQRTGGLAVSGSQSPDEDVLDRRLGVNSTGRPLTAAPAGKAKPDAGQASLKREVKP
jgi:hypothetical protein